MRYVNSNVRSLGLVALTWMVVHAPPVTAQETQTRPPRPDSRAGTVTDAGALPVAIPLLPPSLDAPEATNPPEGPGVAGRPKPPAVAPDEEEELITAPIVFVGSRRAIRSVLDSPTPVDTLGAEDFINQGTTDMDGLLRTLIPSYNVSPQVVSDGAILIRPANLRGLPPDSTVVLLNGKRRHRGSVIAFLGSGISDGAQGVDLAPIPSLALKRVEVLRDGAAAQYGSDAIAGVMNFVLRDDASGVRVVSRVGSTYEGDGTAWSVAANAGLPVTDSGFFNLTVEYGNTDPTSRSVQRADAAQLITNGLPVADPAQVWGNPEISDELKIFANFGLDLGNGVNIYAFGNIARRDILGFFFFRNPTNRGGVYSADGGDTLLVGDLTPSDANACPVVEVRENAVIDPVALARVADDPHCFVFNELFPGGFQPKFGGRVTDLSLAGGVRGVTRFGLVWDLSAVVGSNQADFRIVDTVNASLGPDTPTEFNPGSYREVDQTYNLDLSYTLGIGTYSPLTVAAGTEFRIETFTVVAGEVDSAEAGPLASQGFSIGSNGFPGFPTNIAGRFDRKNIAGYVDFTTDIIKPWTVQLAGRVENFDTFGTQGTVKASTRFQLSDLLGGEFNRGIAVRGAVGTGFRAPSAGQVNVSNVTTVIRTEGDILVQRGTIPPTNPIAVSKGGTELDPETSVNVTAGVVVMFDDLLQFTADFYNISVKDRISQSATQRLTTEEAQALEASGIRGATELSEFRFFTSAFDTITRGVDVVATSQLGFGEFGDTILSAAYAWNETEVGSFTEGVIDDDRISELEQQLPKHRFVITGNHRIGPLRALLRGSYYSRWKNPTSSSGDTVFGGKFLVDTEVAYTFLDRFTLVAGVHNLFNTFPDENPADTQALMGSTYPENSAIGLNGGFWYFRFQAEL